MAELIGFSYTDGPVSIGFIGAIIDSPGKRRVGRHVPASGSRNGRWGAHRIARGI
jgi:hypothetical protein